MSTVIKQYTYTLECGHKVKAFVPSNDTASAYKQGASVICPQDHYARKKISSVVIT